MAATISPAANDVGRLVGQARRLAADGVGRDEGADRLFRLADGNADALEAAQFYWAPRVKQAKTDWEDYRPALALGMLEEALARTGVVEVDRNRDREVGWWQRLRRL